MFRLRSNYLSTALELCFDFLDKNWIFFSNFLTYASTITTKIGCVWALCSTYVSIFSPYVFTFSTEIGVLRFCARAMFRPSGLKLGMLRLSRPMFGLSRPKLGVLRCVLDLKLLLNQFRSREESRANRPVWK